MTRQDGPGPLGEPARRREALAATWRELEAVARRLDVEVRLFGSFARGTSMAHSDLDVMVMGRPGEKAERAFEEAAYDAARTHGVELDLHWGSFYAPDAVERLLAPDDAEAPGEALRRLAAAAEREADRLREALDLPRGGLPPDVDPATAALFARSVAVMGAQRLFSRLVGVLNAVPRTGLGEKPGGQSKAEWLIETLAAPAPGVRPALLGENLRAGLMRLHLACERIRDGGIERSAEEDATAARLAVALAPELARAVRAFVADANANAEAKEG